MAKAQKARKLKIIEEVKDKAKNIAKEAKSKLGKWTNLSEIRLSADSSRDTENKVAAPSGREDEYSGKQILDSFNSVYLPSNSKMVRGGTEQ